MTATGGAGRGGFGWAILVAALAVPGFLFYNWWSHLKADHAISAKASKRADGGMFQTPPPSSGRLINPMASSTSAPAGMPPASAAPRPPATFPATAPAAAMTSAPAMTSAGTPPAAVRPAAGTPPGTLGGPPLAPAASAAVLATTATFVLSRDPTLSPLDVARLHEEEQAEAAAKWALTHAPKGERPKKRSARPIESRIELQGIVAKDGNNLAMINGLTVSSGESLAVDGYPGKVKILKITSSSVTLDYKGRRFRLSAD